MPEESETDPRIGVLLVVDIYASLENIPIQRYPRNTLYFPAAAFSQIQRSCSPVPVPNGRVCFRTLCCVLMLIYIPPSRVQLLTGMDKILQSMGSRDGGISVTNDGATILRAIHVDNAAAKVLVNIAKTQARVHGYFPKHVAVSGRAGSTIC